MAAIFCKLCDFLKMSAKMTMRVRAEWGRAPRPARKRRPFFIDRSANGGRARGERGNSRKSLSGANSRQNPVSLRTLLALSQLQPRAQLSRERPAPWRTRSARRRTTRDAARSLWRKSFASTSGAGEEGRERGLERLK